MTIAPKYLKYAGSKARILPEVSELLLDTTDQFKVDGKLKRFVEPFFGSGVVGMNVPAHEKIFNDFNEDIMLTHRAVIQNPERVIELCERLWKLGYTGYYHAREDFRALKKTDSIFTRAALFIYMNRFGFNGMVRYNQSGKFNVPVGKSTGKNPPAIPVDEILDFGNHIKLIDLCKGSHDFETVMKLNADKRTTIYCDPPYINLNGKGEIKYTEAGFTLETQERLAKAAEDACNRGSRVLVSNHDLEITRELYKNATRIVEIEAFRSISSKGGTRGNANEIVAIYE